MAGNRRKRLDALLGATADNGGDAFLVTNLANVSYLTGFTGSSGFVLLTPGNAYFLTDSRYKIQGAEEVKGFELVLQKGRWTEDISALIREAGARKVCFESRHVSVDTHRALKKSAEGTKFLPVKDAVERLRAVKDADEIEAITKAVRRAEGGYRENISRLAPGTPERDAAIGLEFGIRAAGSRKVPFDIIVASGPRAALPHGIASARKMKAGDTVIVDFGGEAGGYQSDITRSGVLGRPKKKQSEVYAIVAEAQARAIEAVKPGVSCREVDRAARGYIESRGYGEMFGHGLGHGVGLDVHEAPSVSHLSGETLEAGMVITIEPGIYIPGWGGFRIEDMLLVTDDGCRVLTSLGRDIII